MLILLCLVSVIFRICLPTHAESWINQQKETLAGWEKAFFEHINDEYPKIKLSQPLRRGESSPQIPILRKQLFWHGLYEDEETESLVYDEALFKAVCVFQEQHHLSIDGVIGPKTTRILNWTPRVLWQKIRLNQKRLETLSLNTPRAIVVNVALYHLYALTDGAITRTHKVVVGTPKRKTPLFDDVVGHIMVNPFWDLPIKLLIEDKLPRIRNNPDYLIDHHYTVQNLEGELLDPRMIDWTEVSKDYCPYHVRQLPGPHNALGRVKFHLLKNTLAIYMHDTTDKNLFKYPNRAKSSGCIRIENPEKLALWALQGTKSKIEIAFQKALDSGAKTFFPIKETLPVSFVYLTVESSGETLLWSDDPYDYDTKELCDSGIV